MPSLIDADALKEYMDSRVFDLREMYGDYDHYTDGFDDALQVVEYAPIIDAVEVVRCKDCIFRPTTKGDMYGTDVVFPYEDMCPLQCEDPYYNQMMDGDFFCANGERSDDDA